uniref:Uncharacterized protein n=1 Tax=Peronospora matthiolae TaxID=2874970 RepID=A0AAV1US42_9STRA
MRGSADPVTGELPPHDSVTPDEEVGDRRPQEPEGHSPREGSLPSRGRRISALSFRRDITRDSRLPRLQRSATQPFLRASLPIRCLIPVNRRLRLSRDSKWSRSLPNRR